MNHESVNKLTLIKSEINKKILSLNLNDYFPNIIAVSKTFPLHIIEPLIQNGHTHFGENKVQEALTKWESIKQKNKELKLHMLGKLQTNKVKFAVGLFDYLHSVDNIKLAEKIANVQQKNNLKPIKNEFLKRIFSDKNNYDIVESESSSLNVRKILPLHKRLAVNA